MTSGKFKSLAISEISVDRDARQRRELPDLQELADSIATVGLINPIVVNLKHELIAGERRLTACAEILGWTHITVQYAEDLPREELYLIELEENVKRVDLDWRDQCRAVETYHAMRKQREDSWTSAQTAKALGITPAEASNRMMVSKALESGDEMVGKADKYSVALGIVRRKAERAQASSKDKLSAMLTGSSTPLIIPDAADYELPEGVEIPEAPEPIKIPYLHADFTEIALEYTGVKFNFLHCDFPYGVNAGKHNMGAGKAFGGYEDSADVYWTLLDTLAEAMTTMVADSAHMMFWFSLDYYHETKVRLESMGWRVNPFPLIWYKSDNSGILPDAKRGPRRNYETAFLCSRGDRLIVQAVSNVAAAPNIKTIHMSEKNPDMLRHFFRMFVDEHSYVLDPTMGSGNAIRVAEEMGAALVLGLERDLDFYTRACEAYVSGWED